MEFEFRSFPDHFIVLGKVPLLFAKQSCDYRRVAKSSTKRFKTDFGSHRRVTNAVFEGVGCGENVRFK